ncbi:MAG: ice-binding family protein [Paludibacter sp.]|nr:ice-binding family protein [Paludibacter sp.]
MKIRKLLSTLAIVSVVLFVGCKNDDYVSVNVGPCPLVISVTPVNGATLVGRSLGSSIIASNQAARTTLVTATFNKKMDPKTINESSFMVKVTGGSAIVGTVTYTDSTATFTAPAKFADNTTFEARVTTAAKDKMGNALQADYVWTFSTGATILPVVIATDPLNLATGVALNKVITATFSMPMDPTTITATTFTLMNGTSPVSGTVSTVGAVATFTPGVALSPATVYTAKMSMAAMNLDGSTIAKDTTWKFTTLSVYSINITSVNGVVVKNPNALTYNSGTNVQLTATANVGYTFSSWSGDATGTTNPLTVNVNANKNITANFTSNASNFTLNVTAVGGSVSRNPNQLTYPNGTNVVLTPTANAGYTFTSWSGDVTSTVSPLTVNMNSNKNITANFTAATGTGPGNINLGGAAIYTILSKSGISTIGVTSITGNIGVSPATATAITGFGLIMDPSNVFSKSSPSTLVSGNVYAADYAVPTPANISTAVIDMQTAFTTANGLTTSVITELGAGDITGMTLVPGLYKWSTGLLISASGVTLTGGPNDTWVFQIGQGMTVANGAIIHLAGGAQAKNIYWITASDAVIGSTVNFSGNILSYTKITVNTGSTVTGRLLGQTAVTLNAATVVLP